MVDIILPQEFVSHRPPPGVTGDIILLEFSPEVEGFDVCPNCLEIPPGNFVAWRVMHRRYNENNVRIAQKWLAGRWVYGQTILADCPVCAGGSRQEFLRINSGLEGVVLQSGVKALDCTLDNFIAIKGTERALEIARYVLYDVTNEQKERSALFVGDYGVGKTHLLCGILNAVRKCGIFSFYTTAERMLAELRATFESSTKTHDVIGKYIKVPVLAIDELTRIQSGSEWVTTNLFEIINTRLSSSAKLTIFASNDTIDEMVHKEAFAAIASRLSAGYVEHIQATDMRPAIGIEKNKEIKQ